MPRRRTPSFDSIQSLVHAKVVESLAKTGLCMSESVMADGIKKATDAIHNMCVNRRFDRDLHVQFDKWVIRIRDLVNVDVAYAC